MSMRNTKAQLIAMLEEYKNKNEALRRQVVGLPPQQVHGPSRQQWCIPPPPEPRFDCIGAWTPVRVSCKVDHTHPDWRTHDWEWFDCEKTEAFMDAPPTEQEVAMIKEALEEADLDEGAVLFQEENGNGVSDVEDQLDDSDSEDEREEEAEDEAVDREAAKYKAQVARDGTRFEQRELECHLRKFKAERRRALRPARIQRKAKRDIALGRTPRLIVCPSVSDPSVLGGGVATAASPLPSSSSALPFPAFTPPTPDSPLSGSKRRWPGMGQPSPAQPMSPAQRLALPAPTPTAPSVHPPTPSASWSPSPALSASVIPPSWSQHASSWSSPSSPWSPPSSATAVASPSPSPPQRQPVSHKETQMIIYRLEMQRFHAEEGDDCLTITNPETGVQETWIR